MQILCTFFGFLPTSFEIFFSALGNIGGDSKWVVAKEVNGKMFYKLINVLWSYFSIFKHCVSLIRCHMVCAVAYLLNTTSSQTSFATIKKKTQNHILENFHCAHCHNIATLAATASELLQRKSVRKLSAKNTPPHEPCGSCSALHSV